MIPHLFAGKIQHVLISRKARLPSGNGDGPVGMRPVQIGIGGNHLRLKPDAKLHAKLIDLVHQIFEAAIQLLFVYHPVAKGPVVVKTVSEPAVVHDQHLDPKAGRFPGNGDQLVRIKVKIGRLPVIDQNRTLFIPVLTPDQVFSVKIVEGAGHFPKALSGISHHHLGCLELRSRHQLPAEILRIDSHHHTDLLIGILLHLHPEISGVYKMHGIDLPCLLGGSRCLQRHKGVILMACLSPKRFHRVLHAAYRQALNMALPCPGPVKRDGFKLPVIHIQTCGIDLGQVNILRALIDHPDTPCDHVRILKHTVLQDHLKSRHAVLTQDLQYTTLILPSKGSRHLSEGSLPPFDLVGHVIKGECRISSQCPDADTALTAVSDSMSGIFHGKAVKKRYPVTVVHGGHERTLLCAQKIARPVVRELLPIIDMCEEFFLIHNSHNITGVRSIQLKKPLLFIKNNRHGFQNLL